MFLIPCEWIFACDYNTGMFVNKLKFQYLLQFYIANIIFEWALFLKKSDQEKKIFKKLQQY